MTQNHYQLYVVRREFRSGELNTTLQTGEVIEVDQGRRVCKYRGKETVIRAILSAISMKWITPPRPDEMAHIRAHGVSQERQYETPDLAKIQAERAKAMKESIPEDMRAEVNSGLSEERQQSMRLQDAQAPDQYAVEGAATTQRIAGQQDMPQDPVSQVIDGSVPPRKTKEGASTVPAPGSMAAGIRERALAAAAKATKAADAAAGEMAPSKMAAETPAEDEDLSAYDHEPTEEELAEMKAKVDAADKEPTYDGDFDFKKRLSKEREQQLRTMPLAELAQLSTFLIHRDKVEGNSRKITEQVKEIFHEREAKESKLPAPKKGAEGKAVRTASSAPAAVPADNSVLRAKFTPPSPQELSFEFDTSLPDNVVLHSAQMRLSPEQVRELSEVYGKAGHPLAKQLADIARSRAERSGPRVKNEKRRTESTPSIDPNEGAVVNALLGGTQLPQPTRNSQASPNVGAISNPSDDELLNSATPSVPSAPTVPQMNQSAKAIDMTPVNLRPGETEAVDIGNLPSPGEVQPFIGSEEGTTQVMDIAGATQRALQGQPEGRDPNVADISGSIGQVDY